MRQEGTYITASRGFDEGCLVMVVELGDFPPRPAKESWAKQRILDVVARGEPPRYPPGAQRYQQTRRGVGGGWVPSRLFRRLVDELVEEGRLLECWLDPGLYDERYAPHVLIRPDMTPGPLQTRVVRARGRESI